MCISCKVDVMSTAKAVVWMGFYKQGQFDSLPTKLVSLGCLSVQPLSPTRSHFRTHHTFGPKGQLHPDTHTTWMQSKRNTSWFSSNHFRPTDNATTTAIASLAGHGRHLREEGQRWVSHIITWSHQHTHLTSPPPTLHMLHTSCSMDTIALANQPACVQWMYRDFKSK